MLDEITRDKMYVKASARKMSSGSRGGILSASGVIILCIVVRLLLISSGWPHSNMDEGTMGLMGINIAYHGDHPVFYYGQDYMGALQGYMAAGFFRLAGPSLLNLRLPLLLLFTIFLIAMYLLARLLYTQRLALFSTFLLGLGSYLVVYRETQAIGGYPDTLASGSLALLLAAWLALTSRAPVVPGLQWKRLLAFSGWGVVAGIGLWCDFLVAPTLVMSGLLLLIFCWRELRSLAPVGLLLGLLVGALPLLLFNLHAPPGHDSLTTLLNISQLGHGSTPHDRLASIRSVLLIGLPTFSNYPSVCPVTETLYFGGSGRHALLCAFSQGAWSLGVIILWCGAAALAVWTIIRHWRRTPAGEKDTETRRTVIIACARLALLCAAALSFASFALSPTALYSPYLSSRYLIAILFATPAVLYPLWYLAGHFKTVRGGFPRLLTGGAIVALLFIASMYMLAMGEVYATIPRERATNEQKIALVNHLSQIGVTHIYSDFLSCDALGFFSQEHILCDTMDEQMRPTGSRYGPFGKAVEADPLASYVFPVTTPQAKMGQQYLTAKGIKYKSYTYNGYVVYQPTALAAH